MSIIGELHRELFQSIADGRAEALAEAPIMHQVAGLKKSNYEALHSKISVTDLPNGVLGQTGIARDGSVGYVAVNKKIPYLVEGMMKFYNKSIDWAKKVVYNIGKLATEHELAHAQSSYVIAGEEHNQNAVDIMESVTTYAKHKVAKKLGKHQKAALIKATNPYPKAWLLGNTADWAPYSGPAGEGYAAFMRDAQKEPFYKPLWRLTKAAAKKAVNNGKEYVNPKLAAA